DCVVNPTRAYRPQDKALVENAVQLSYQRIFYPLREMAFFSLRDLNREIGKLLESYNNMLFQRKEASRKELFQSVERTVLKPLPVGVYHPGPRSRRSAMFTSPRTRATTASPTDTSAGRHRSIIQR